MTRNEARIEIKRLKLEQEKLTARYMSDMMRLKKRVAELRKESRRDRKGTDGAVTSGSEAEGVSAEDPGEDSHGS